MSLISQSIEEIVSEYRTHETDTGSPEVQIAILTHKIRRLTEHLKAHRHDFNSRRGMQIMVSHRKKLLRYLRGQDIARFQKIVKSLGIRAKQFDKEK